ncbi:MAG: selenocysteine-specific translation elongation factor [Blastocatellia bacterium]|nr:selenocysteine-specific translation elongation factor [Blastocatellia bacterium]MCS7157647.1 selenocysteine-specific translation elongation factor [Blastocatellia bacterium]MCX7751912.1 selenocysteine-specific translation elongation factor [Blastocatellia bacterium]MDW8167018.1 selenocysteine-specific translation elongation factor [Acidobacteriota bacterium]MDW8257122.1 selenocysteine-specific translation elongation factor [Acidobacteriota bacterium]
MRHIIVGTAGHIDHGKTALVKALTGIDTDRLKEEKERGITIDIGFAFLTLGQTRLGFVDVPGHERFIKNMLAGAHGIDLVLLVVAADESVMPQTREHFDICRLLRVKSGLVAITKVDLVDEEMLEVVEAEVRDLVAGSFLDGAPIVRVSARTGEGIEELKAALAGIAATVAEKRRDAVPRLPIDRVFTVRGFGTVVTGTLIAGQFAIGDEVDILPSQRRATIRGLQVHGQSVSVAVAGERTAMNLQGVAVEDLERGQVVVSSRRFVPTSRIDARLELLPTAPQAVQTRTRLRLHVGTAEILSRVVLLDRTELRPGESGLVQFRLESPTFVLPGDRFIVRRYSPPLTIGGGEVLDALPEKHRAFRLGAGDREAVVAALLQVEAADARERLALWVEGAGKRGMSYPELVARTDLLDSHLQDALRAHCMAGRLIELASTPRYFLARAAYEEVKATLQRALAAFHQEYPLNPGMPHRDVRALLLRDVPEFAATELLARLGQEPEFHVEREWVRLATHAIRLSEEEAEIERTLLEIFREAKWQPPTLEEVIQRRQLDPEKARKLYQLLLHRGALVRVGEHTFAAEALQELIERVRQQKSVSTMLDVGTFKALTGVSRKYAIPLLEYLDRQHVTRRVGDARIIL